MYHDAEGVPQDYAEAVKWYGRAADQGTAAAQFNLGVVYYLGQGVQQDLVKAEMWSILASENSSPGSQRDNAIRNRDVMARKMTSAQLEEARRLALEWKPHPVEIYNLRWKPVGGSTTGPTP